MSRAGLGPELHGLVDEFVDFLRHEEEVSRAGLRRKLSRLLLILPVRPEEASTVSGTE